MKIPSIKRDINIIEIDFGEYYVNNTFQYQYQYQYVIGNKILSGVFKTAVKLTQRQVRKMKKSWYQVVRECGHLDWASIHFDTKTKVFMFKKAMI